VRSGKLISCYCFFNNLANHSSADHRSNERFGDKWDGNCELTDAKTQDFTATSLLIMVGGGVFSHYWTEKFAD
jgi:hypothetical protein